MVSCNDGSASQTCTFTVTNVAEPPLAPTIGAATAGNGQATVAFTPPHNTGGQHRAVGHHRPHGDFGRRAASSAAVHAGTDADPQALLLGPAAINGTRVVQRVQGGVAGVTYRVRAQVDASDGSRYVLAGLLPVRAA